MWRSYRYRVAKLLATLSSSDGRLETAQMAEWYEQLRWPSGIERLSLEL